MPTSRGYRSERREQQASETRSAILGVARTLFAANGYAATTLAEIAAQAGVSVPTLYASVGNKTTIALSLVEVVEHEPELRETRQAQATAGDGPELIERNVRFVLAMKTRCGDVMRALASAVATDPGVAPGMQDLLNFHREGQLEAAARLAELGALREGIDEPTAAAILVTIGSPEIVTQLQFREGWPMDRIEAWLLDALRRLLLP